MNPEFLNNDTICAPATPVGGGAVSIIRLSGPRCFEIVDSVVEFINSSAAQSKGYRLKRGKLAALDDVLVGIFRAPKSYTGEDCAEIYCHASPYIVRSALELLCEKGCRMAEAGEFTRRSFLNGKMDLAQAEAVADLIAASSEAQHRVASSQLRGGYSQELRLIRGSLVELSALLELELDFSEEDVEFADRSRLENLLGSALARCETLADSFALGNAIRNGIPLAIAGAPNSGKSTLLNALLGDERAIVSDIPGTTRDTVEDTKVIGGVLFRFIDTAGIRESSDQIERMGIERSVEALRKAYLSLCVVDLNSENAVQDCLGILNLCRECGQKVLLVLNKIDLAGKTGEEGGLAPVVGSKTDDLVGNLLFNKNVSLINKIVSSYDYEGIVLDSVRISAKSGFGLDKLRELIVSACGIDLQGDILVTSKRHADALRSSAAALRACLDGLHSGISPDLLAEDLREALNSLGSITGEITSDEVLGEIFGKFCVGK
ncbi:MAG: tRNA uridine-5-carboxymethylaminomethyl(34) synthesis GTPase MnmE [Candidatus Cryptobacteroides sp.]